MTCPSESDLAAYSEGRSPPAERSAIEAHLASCDECRQLVSLLAQAVSSASAPTISSDDDEVEDADAALRYPPGTVLGGKYRVERQVGAGGMGVVLEATHLGLEQRVAIKLLKRDAKRVPGALERFVREARACARIKSDHVVRVSDTGQFETGEPYIVMDLLQGEDVRSRWSRPQSMTFAVDVVLQACDALDEAHREGIVHRDIKPANLFITTDKEGNDLVKVLDFGISKLKTEGVPSMTSQNITMGSPRYMSPEQLKTPRDVDARTDIWALGVVLYELVSGKPPFDAESLAGLAGAILTDTPAPMQAVPVELAQAIGRCLEKDPARRYPNVGQLAAALKPFGSSRMRSMVDRLATAAPDMATTPTAGGPPPSGFEATVAMPRRGSRFGTGWLVGGLIGLISAVGAAGAVLLAHGKPVAAPTASATMPPQAFSSPPPSPSVASSVAPSVASPTPVQSTAPRVVRTSPAASKALPTAATSVAAPAVTPPSSASSHALRVRQ